jgi:hypothetical protein
MMDLPEKPKHTEKPKRIARRTRWLIVGAIVVCLALLLGISWFVLEFGRCGCAPNPIYFPTMTAQAEARAIELTLTAVPTIGG